VCDDAWVLLLYTLAIFVGALLLFLVQPMMGRMLLPLLGGAPAVWNTAMLFYQAMLLAGYAYAHFSTRWLGVRRQVLLHIVVLILATVALPIGIPKDWLPPTDHNPVWWVLILLTVAAGLPFFAVSATSPLLQRWFSAGKHRHSNDPYFLYAASNLGSLLALVAYPALIEPRLQLGQQSRYWALGYVLLVALIVSCGLWLRRMIGKNSPASEVLTEVALDPLSARRRWRWILLAFVPCSLMLSVTTYITTEVAPIPLLWVIPLGIYLLTFILVFAKRQLVSHTWMVRALPVAVLLLVILLTRTLTAEPSQLLGWSIALNYVGLFIVAMVCHGELAKDRPATPHLTEFYLWISVGGVLGGMFNALLSPLIFPTVIEYPITLLLACLLLPGRTVQPAGRRAIAWDVAWPMLLGLFTAGLIRFVARGPLSLPALVLVFGLPSVLCLSFMRRPLRFTLGVLALLLAITLTLRPGIRTPLVARSFFGVHRVDLFPGNEHIHIFRHGTTMHGMQSLEPRQRRIPLLYFTRSGPLGQTMAMLPAELKQQVAVLGLGAGTLACYAEAGQRWTFYEIDPLVERVARDPQYFTYLQDCPAELSVILGDGRLSLQHATDGEFGVIILDAYSSDTPPLHLLTREALALYMRKLRPDGVLLFNITNRHLDLEPVLANLARDAGLLALCNHDSAPIEEFYRSGKMPSSWIVMSRQSQRLTPLAQDSHWQPARTQQGVGTWTDDYTSLFRVFYWK